MNTSTSRRAENSLPSVPVLMTALICAIFAFQLNASMLSPALVTMEHQLGVDASQIGLTQTAFFAAAALFSLFLPRWGDLIGRRRIMLWMLTITAIGCIISGLSAYVGGVTMLAVGRVVQGVAGPIVPMALIMLHVQVPDNRQYAKLMAVLTAVNGGIAGVDAMAGGWLAEHWGFQSVFFTMAVVCVIAVVAISFGTVESRGDERVPMDWKGTFPLVVVLGALYFAFNEAGKLAEANWLVFAGLIVVAIVAFAVFWSVENRVAHPLVTTTYLKQRRTWALLGTTLLTMTGVFAVMNGLVPSLAQDGGVGPGISAAEVSFWTLSPYAIAGLLMGPVSGQLASRFGFKRVLQAGLILTSALLLFTVFVADRPSRLLLLLICIAVGIAYAGMVNIMLNGLGVVLSPADNQGYLPGMNSGAFNLGAGLSFAILYAINTFVGQSAGVLAGYRWAIAGGAFLVLCSLAFSTLIPRPDDVSDTASTHA